MKMKITSTSNPAMVELRLSDAPVASEVLGDVIADLNGKGNWVRGLEVLGSGDQPILHKALTPLTGEKSDAGIRVTYDKEADAGFVYLPYASSEKVQRVIKENPLLTKVSYSVEDNSAVLGLAADQSLVLVRFKVPPTESMDSFMELFA
jgi:hypothetical protein